MSAEARFLPGDLVRCVDAANLGGLPIQEGGVYEVRSTTSLGVIVQVTQLTHDTYVYSRFEHTGFRRISATGRKPIVYSCREDDSLAHGVVIERLGKWDVFGHPDVRSGFDRLDDALPAAMRLYDRINQLTHAIGSSVFIELVGPGPEVEATLVYVGKTGVVVRWADRGSTQAISWDDIIYLRPFEPNLTLWDHVRAGE